MLFENFFLVLISYASIFLLGCFLGFIGAKYYRFKEKERQELKQEIQTLKENIKIDKEKTILYIKETKENIEKTRQNISRIDENLEKQYQEINQDENVTNIINLNSEILEKKDDDEKFLSNQPRDYVDLDSNIKVQKA